MLRVLFAREHEASPLAASGATQQLRDQALRLREVCGAEKIKMVQHMVEVVEVFARGIAFLERMRLMVRSVERLRQSSEQQRREMQKLPLLHTLWC